MRQLAYISTAAELAESEVGAILASAERHNPPADITGFLLYNGSNFLQVIEGPAASLSALMNRLVRDERHTGLVVVENSEIEARSCPDWAMRRVSLLDAPGERQAALDATLPAQLPGPTRRLVMNFAALN